MSRIRPPADLRPVPGRGGGLLLAVGFALSGAAACEIDEERDADPLPVEVREARTQGFAFMEEHRLEEAETAFQRVVELAPGRPAAYADLAMVRLRMGRLEEARELAERAVELAPRNLEHRRLLSRILEVSGEEEEALAQLATALEEGPDQRRTLYTLARLRLERDEPEAALPHLERLAELEDWNTVVLVELAGTRLRTGDADGAVAALEDLRRQMPVFPMRGEEAFETALEAARRGDVEPALDGVEVLHGRLRTTGRYHEDSRMLRGPEGVLPGVPDVEVLPRGADDREVPDREEVAEAIRFVDVTERVGLADVPPRRPPAGSEPVAVAVGDLFDNGFPDVYVGSGLLFRNEGGTFVEVAEETELPTDRPAVDARLTDLGNRGRLDLYLVRDGPDVLLRGEEDGGLRDVTGEAGIDAPGAGAGVIAVDVDHDGDLDLLVVGEGAPRLFRNDAASGTFTEMAAEKGLSEVAGGAGAAFADFDGDDRIDLVVARRDEPPALLLNRGHEPFEDVSEAAWPDGTGGATAMAVGDYDSDGLVDLFLAGTGPDDRRLYRGTADGRFEVDERPEGLYRALADLRISDALFVDYDNDGWLDLLVAGEPEEPGDRGLRLFRQAGPGEWVDVSSSLPHLEAASRVAAFDFSGDGDLDLFVTLPDGTVRLLRNDGGNVNHSLTLRLTGLGPGVGKNNHLGVGAKVEVRAADLYQRRHVTGPVTVFGLGQHPRAELVRITWPNGLTQEIFTPDPLERAAEEAFLQGSCPFLYAWDGDGFEFVTDVLWQNALGMYAGIGGVGSGDDHPYAPPDPSRAANRVPGDALEPRDGEYLLQFTNELWETTYLDKVRLVAVDHPDSVDVFMDERFPARDLGPEPRLHAVRERRPPVSATDGEGRDLLPTLREHDHRYVTTFRSGPYQGLTAEPHDLVLDLGDLPEDEEVRLFLRGWFLPTNAHINYALDQTDELEAMPPSLEVRDADGEWITVEEELGVPAGKDKTMVVELTGRFPTPDDRSVRIRTNQGVHWGHAFVETGPAEAPVRRTVLEPTGAELWERGFSRMYRKGGRHGPHWFDWDDVSETVPWGRVEGRFTRPGDVLPLLREEDDMYVVMAQGDAIELRFDAGAAPPLPDGWRRTFLFYPVGWVKDGDLHTATGDRTDPLPFHGMTRYPYGPDEAYPATPEHRRYLEEYHTRERGMR